MAGRGRWVWAILGVVGLLFLADSAQALVLCARERKDGAVSGSLKVRETCKAKETQIDPEVLGLQGPQGVAGEQGVQGEPGPPGPQGEPAAPRLLVRDANDVDVGSVLGGYSGGADVTMSVNGARALFFVNENGFMQFRQSSMPVFFASKGCSGQPLLRMPDNGIEVGSAALLPRAEIWGTHIYIPVDPLIEHTYNSTRIQFFDQASCEAITGLIWTEPDFCCAPGREPSVFPLSGAIEFDVVDLGFVPPFHVEGP